MKTLLLIVLLAMQTAFLQAQNGCIDPSLIDESVICPAVYDPVCGCDGVTYSNSCVALNYHGVSSWQLGECTAELNCMDLALYDFGLCSLPLGIALINGQCQMVSGCSTQIDDVDYAPYFYTEMEDCLPCAQLHIDSCENLAGIDFGECDQFLGYGIINGQCTSISGCNTVATNGLDYAVALHNSPEECEAACLQVGPCQDLTNVNFGLCEMLLGYGLINGSCEPISGCGTIAANGVDYANAIHPSPTACEMFCGQHDGCLDLSQVDFGACATVLGVIWDGQNCTSISGCSMVGSDGVDYSQYFFDSTEACAGCSTTGITQNETNHLQVYPTVFSGELNLSEAHTQHLSIALFNSVGKVVFRGSAAPGQKTFAISGIAPGMYFYTLTDINGIVATGKLIHR